MNAIEARNAEFFFSSTNIGNINKSVILSSTGKYVNEP
jgi:hypothetical protein